jgi:hypothetical protein
MTCNPCIALKDSLKKEIPYYNYIILIGTRKQRTDVGKYSFVERTIESWNQLTASLLN